MSGEVTSELSAKLEVWELYAILDLRSEWEETALYPNVFL